MDFAAVNEIYIRYKASKVPDAIHPDDVMYNSGKGFYFNVGEDGLRVVLRGLSLTWCQGVQRILDLPCGHGRVARHLRAGFPGAEVFFCDIDRSGVDFCAKTFEGTGIYSEPDLTRVDLPRDLDVIWVGSLFTHVDRTRTTAWLHYLAQHLREFGIIVATFRGLSQFDATDFGGDADAGELHRVFEETGFGYAVYKKYLKEDYGTTLVRPSAICKIAEQVEDTRILAYIERGWANRQDVLVLCKHNRMKR
jgi:SAM-dependent methyltransferase